MWFVVCCGGAQCPEIMREWSGVVLFTQETEMLWFVGCIEEHAALKGILFI